MRARAAESCARDALAASSEHIALGVRMSIFVWIGIGVGLLVILGIVGVVKLRGSAVGVLMGPVTEEVARKGLADAASRGAMDWVASLSGRCPACGAQSLEGTLDLFMDGGTPIHTAECGACGWSVSIRTAKWPTPEMARLGEGQPGWLVSVAHTWNIDAGRTGGSVSVFGDGEVLSDDAGPSPGRATLELAHACLTGLQRVEGRHMSQQTLMMMVSSILDEQLESVGGRVSGMIG